MKTAMRFILLLTLILPSVALAGDKPYPFLAGADRASIILRWAPPDTGFPPEGFNIYRRSQKGKAWKKLNPSPLKKITDEKILRKRLGDDLFKAVSALISPAPLNMKGKRSRKLQEENRRSLLLLYADFSPKVADVLGLRWEDRDVKKGNRYLYRLSAVDPQGREKTLATLPQPIGLEDYRPVTKARAFSARAGDSEVSFSWLKEPRFSAYNLYRSDEKNGTYKKINTAPIIILTTTDKTGKEKVSDTLFKDSKVINGKTYWYYLEGVDAFGRKSIPSKKLSATPVDLTPPLPPRGFKTEVKGATVALSWEKSPEEDAFGYHVYRGQQYKGPFVRLTKKTIPTYYTRYKDTGLPLGAIFWYYVTAVDTSGNESGPSYTALANVVDRVPPEPPKALKGKAEPGKILLSWTPNKEEDLAGYRVFRSMDKNSKHYQLLNQEPSKKATFANELPKTASDNPFFFKIKAVDTSGNESGFSNVVEVKLPDVTPPVAPVFKGFQVKEGAVEISWYPNTESDIAGYNLFRTKAGAGPAERAALNKKLIPKDELSFSDGNLVSGQRYAYELQAVDTSKNPSPFSRVLTAATFDKTPPPAPEGLHGLPLKDGKGIVLTWKMPKAKDLKGVVLYRAREKAGPYYPITPLTFGSRFLDAKVHTARTYFYKIAAFDQTNNRSPYSKPVKVMLEKKKEQTEKGVK